MNREKQRVPDEIQKWAVQASATKVRKILGCSGDVATRLHKGMPVFLDTFELEWMQHQYRRMRKLYRDHKVPLAITVDRPSRVKHKVIIRMMAEFVAKNITQILTFTKGGGENFSTYRWHSMYKPLYDFGALIRDEVLPYLLYVWNEYPEVRNELFGGTGFEEYVRTNKRKPRPSP